MSNPTIRIWYEDLHVSVDQEALPLSRLSAEDCIHGGLRIEIAGRQAPYLGFFGPDDVCFGDWLHELRGVVEAFTASDNTSYLYDEGEQSQPGFLFERQADRGFLSIIDSQISGGKADPAWQRVEFSADALLTEYQRVYELFYAALKKAAPLCADEWMRVHNFAIPQ
jgi:hypothetical protein